MKLLKFTLFLMMSAGYIAIAMTGKITTILTSFIIYLVLINLMYTKK